MAKMLKHFRRKKSKADEFQITASVSSLTIECVKEKWHPTKLVVVWDREKAKQCSTKPVRWQLGIKNPYRGTHVWPEPDPVKTHFSLFKNSGKELLQYQEKPWTILVQNLSLSGRRKIIATGQIDIADYVSEEPSTHDVTVTLRPATKNVVTGSLEFSLSSVLLEDGIPRRTDKEIFDEIMQDAIRSRKQSLQKATTSKSSKGSLQTSSEHKALVSDTDVGEKKTPASPLSGDNKVYDPQEGASYSNNNNAAPKMVKKKAPAPPLPRKSRPARPPPLPKKSRPAPPPPLPAKCRPTPPQSRPPRPPPPSQSKRGVKGSSLNRSQEKIANGHKRLGGTKEKTNYPKELNPFGGTSESEESCFDGDSSPRATSSKKTLTCVLGQEPGYQDEVKTSSTRRKRNRQKKKGKNYPKELNPFGDEQGSLSSESESESDCCKETPEKDSEVIDGPGRCKELDQGDDGKVKGTSNDNAIVSKNVSSDVRESGAVALKTPLIQDEQLEEANGEESSERQLEHDNRGSTPNELVSSVGVEELREAKEGEATKFEETKGEETEGVKSHCRILDEPVLKRAEPYVAVEELSETNGEETSNEKKGDDGPCGTTNELVLQSGKQQERVNGHCSMHDEPLLKRAKPYVPTAFYKMDDKDEESSEGKGGGHCSTLELRTSPNDAANSDMSCSILPVDASTYDRETAVHKEKASPETADGDTSSSAQQEKATPDKADPDTPSSALQKEATPDKADTGIPSSAQQEKATPDKADPDTPSSALQREATPDEADTDIPSSAQQEKATPDKADPDTPSTALQKEATPDKADTGIPSSAQPEKAPPDEADPDSPSTAQQEKATPETADADIPSSALQKEATPDKADTDIPSSAQQEKATPDKADPDTPSSALQREATPDEADTDIPSSAQQEKATPDKADPDTPSSALQREATPDEADTDIPSSAQQEKATPDKADPDTPSSALQREATPDEADTDIPSSAQQEKATPDEADPDTPSTALQKEATPDKADPDTPSTALQKEATPDKADTGIPSSAQPEKAPPDEADPDSPSTAQQEKATPETADADIPSSALQKEATPDKAVTDTPSSAQQEKATPVTADSDIPSTAQQEKATPKKADPGTPLSGNMPGCSHVPEKGFIQESVLVHANQHEHDKAASLVSQPCPELSRYAKEQICLLQEEIGSLDKVSIKLQMELLQAMEMKDCEEELDGLTQDWLSITKYRGELIERKQDLEILVEQHNFDKCCNIIRNELKFLLELEGWRKTDEHRAQQQELLKILLSFNNKRVSISQLY